MGCVYLAEQLEPIRRPVALKVVKLGMDTAQVLARFHNERQTLALMDHPNIARIFDAGATSKGRPYFVMEYIEGAPITQYCDRQSMGITQRLTLFLAVCRAVQHAHGKGVIHRDLKPSNVLVSDQDGAPIPRIIDFGIATAIDKWAVESTLLTQFGQIVGTPEYASPEQSDMTGEIDQASDVYSLGVLLYELLTGTVPFEAAALRNAGLAEMLRMIREDEAPSLPHKLAAMGAAASDIAARRQTDPVSLRRLVNGDLNSITMKALEKARERRYASVSDLAIDIQRYLEHRPVLASPPSRRYRARKLLRRHRLAVIATATGVAFLIVSGVAAWSLSHRDSTAPPKLTAQDGIVLADFENATGDPIFDDTLRQALSTELRQSSVLRLIGDQRVQQTLTLMGQPNTTRLTPRIARDICERTGSVVTLDGSIASRGNQYVLSLQAKTCATESVLDQEQAPASKREDVLNTVSLLARRFRIRVGESPALMETHRAPLWEANTSSLQALKAYATGHTVRLSAGPAASIPYYRRAVELDPQFAMAWANLGIEYGAIGESVSSAESTTTARQLRDRASDRERFFIDFLFDRQVTGNLERAYETLESWLHTYPRDDEPPSPHDLLGGIAAQGTGRLERASEMSQTFIVTHPDALLGYGNLASAYFFLDRFPEAEDILQRAAEHKLEAPRLWVMRYDIAWFAGDKDQMDRIVALARGKHGVDHLIAHAAASAEARRGRLQAARLQSQRAVDLVLQDSNYEAVASYRAARAVWEALCGNDAEAKKASTAALELSNGRDVQYAAGLALGLSGDFTGSEAIAADLEKRFPEDTFVEFTYVPVLRALGELGRGNFVKTVADLEIARQYELAPNSLNFTNFYIGGLHSAYVRGTALMSEQRYPEASAEFQKILDHRGIVGTDPIGALAHLQLGRILTWSGDKAKARAAYEAFLALWKDADSEVSILKAAKAEYAKLQ